MRREEDSEVLKKRIHRIEAEQQVRLWRQAFYSPMVACSDSNILHELEKSEIALQQAINDEIQSRNELIECDSSQTESSKEMLGKLKEPRGTLGTIGKPFRINIEVRMPSIPSGMYHLFDSENYPLVVVDLFYSLNYSRDTSILGFTIKAWIEDMSWQQSEYRELEARSRGSFQVRLLPTLIPEKVRELTEVRRATLHVDPPQDR
ncbi:hypothetical protein GC170_10385 [bacterium]|nr:hypothetical protein [bacterium]